MKSGLKDEGFKPDGKRLAVVRNVSMLCKKRGYESKSKVPLREIALRHSGFEKKAGKHQDDNYPVRRGNYDLAVWVEYWFIEQKEAMHRSFPCKEGIFIVTEATRESIRNCFGETICEDAKNPDTKYQSVRIMLYADNVIVSFTTKK